LTFSHAGAAAASITALPQLPTCTLLLSQLANGLPHASLLLPPSTSYQPSLLLLLLLLLLLPLRAHDPPVRAEGAAVLPDLLRLPAMLLPGVQGLMLGKSPPSSSSPESSPPLLLLLLLLAAALLLADAALPATASVGVCTRNFIV
jgi:hypothetical protein